LADGVAFEDAESAIWAELELLKARGVSDNELEKVKNKFLTAHLFNRVKVVGKALALCASELQGDIGLYDEEPDLYRRISDEQIKDCAVSLFTMENLSVIHYAKTS
jgi:hypothetical protein